MYNLNPTEIRTLNDYHSLRTKNLQVGNLVVEHQRILELLFKQYCDIQYGCEEPTIERIINYCLSADAKFIKNKNVSHKGKFHSHFNEFHFQFFTVNTLRNKISHEGYEPTATETDLSTQYSKECLIYYFKHCIQKLRGDINTSDVVAAQMLNELFPLPSEKEEIVERPKFYVILLIDSSGSMQWPANKLNNGDKQKGLLAVQKEIALAQEKALNSLRGSADCLKRSMLVYQYTFNDEMEILNQPEKLDPFGDDKVKKINSSNYIPGGMTALYSTIEESLKVTYNKYLKIAKEHKRRIDKVSIGVITDGEDNYIDGIQKEKNGPAYLLKKDEKIRSIKSLLRTLRGDGNVNELHLESSVLIGLTGSGLSETKLKEIQKELGFEVSISIDSEDEKSLRQAFKTASTNALNI
jgi:hypothetical protein